MVHYPIFQCTLDGTNASVIFDEPSKGIINTMSYIFMTSRITITFVPLYTRAKSTSSQNNRNGTAV